MSLLISQKNIFFIFVFLIFQSLLSFSSNQKIKDFHLGDKINGTLALDESHEYFKLVIPDGIINKPLIFVVREDPKEYIKTDESFSDPDFYISKINKYPSSGLSSEWFSEKYGNDILTIPGEEVRPGEVFYIGMYCQFKCQYFLHVYSTNEVKISLGKFYSFTMKSMETLNYVLHIDKPFKELNVYVYSKTGKTNYKIFMNKDGPSTQNTFNVIPSWNNGYAFSIKEKTEQYCDNCDYHILIQNENEPVSNNNINNNNYLIELTLYSFVQEERVVLNQNTPSYNVLNSYDKRCFSFPMKSYDIDNEKLIIHYTLFSGEMFILYEGWESKGYEKNNTSEILRKENVRVVFVEGFQIFEKKDYDKYENTFSKKNENKYLNGDRDFHFCVFTLGTETSFTISMYYLTKMDQLNQRGGEINYLFPGNHVIKGYLLKDQIFKYQIVGFNLEKNNGYELKTNITITTTQTSGKISPYVYFCQTDSCVFTKNDITELKNNNRLITANKNPLITEKSLKIEILYNNNVCFTKPTFTLPNGNIIRCSPNVYIYCEEPNSDGLCIYEIKLDVIDFQTLMKPKQMYYGVIPRGKSDFYEITITDEKVHSIVVVLNSLLGDSELYFYKKKIGPSPQLGKKREGEHLNIGDIVSISIHNDYIPDVARITPGMLKQSDVRGSYIIKVNSKTFSSYKIYYYVTYNPEPEDEKNMRRPQVTMNLDLTTVLSDYFPGDIRYKIYSFTPSMSKRKSKNFY